LEAATLAIFIRRMIFEKLSIPLFLFANAIDASAPNPNGVSEEGSPRPLIAEEWSQHEIPGCLPQWDITRSIQEQMRYETWVLLLKRDIARSYQEQLREPEAKNNPWKRDGLPDSGSARGKSQEQCSAQTSCTCHEISVRLSQQEITSIDEQLRELKAKRNLLKQRITRKDQKIEVKETSKIHSYSSDVEDNANTSSEPYDYSKWEVD
jgi:hypothetical protein